jgi:hypothetical protein
LSALEIIYTLTPISSLEKQPHVGEGTSVVKGKEYHEREEVSAIYENHRKVIKVEERTIIV